ncbi:MAG: sigma-70 family RNA polymerase sigma factor [Verrucomicrobiota bacterium]
MPDPDRHDEFMSLFLEFQPRIRAYVRTLIPRQADAEDVFQETAAVLWRKFDQFESGTHFDRWAFRTAYHQARAFRTKKSRDRLQFHDEVLDLLAERAAEQSETLEEQQSALQICVRKLPASDRDLLAHRYEDGATNRSVAHLLGKSESAISRNLNRIYERLLKCVNLTLRLS